VVIQARSAGVVDPWDAAYIKFYNIMARKFQTGLQLTEMGRNFFDRNITVINNTVINIEQHRVHRTPLARNHVSLSEYMMEVSYLVLIRLLK
jgi:hypothetical protein